MEKMTFSKRHIKIISAIIVLTTLLTLFFYIHETLPKPIRAATALIEAPVAIASGLSHYLNLGIHVYETAWAIILSNLIFSSLLLYLINKFIKITTNKRT